MSKSKITLTYSGAGSIADLYNDGALVVHTYTEGKAGRKQVLSAVKGSYELSTLHGLSLTLLAGKVTLQVKKTKTVLKPGESVQVDPSASFTLVVGSASVLLGIPKQGPEYGDNTGEQPDKLR